MKLLHAALVCLLLSFPGYSCTLRMGIETSFAPYIIQQGDSWRGLNVELLARLAQEVDCKLEFIHSPWLRSLKLIEQGELDVLSHLSYNAERSEHFAFIGPHQQEVIYLVGIAKAFPGLTDLKKLKRSGTSGIIALLNGAYYGDELDSILNDAKNRTRFVFIRGNEDKQAMLLNGRVHGVLEDIAAYYYWKKQTDLSTVGLEPLFEVYQSPVYFGFNRRTLSPQQLEQLAKAWQLLYSNGELSRIVQPYQVAEYQFSLPQPASRLPSQEPQL
ncbi:transporter substrate-binding domain-containing protein [Rheinheimera soli]|uniref:ABC-type amino acid transport substrate-binding protein n=1 Tax=Rheinheimera soli TaxID=443616 RepID=A0ABU1VUU1_9GAMM|nr:transporter substrate-binding domain-containing protein [Rheinheimera soli]MDR7119492.1 ABC-type amino acid transport substrate-binding protein [Rheinheimera soli]